MNTEKVNPSEIYKNEEINTMIYTIGAGVGSDFEIKDSSVHGYSKHVLVYKDFHDFNVMLGVRDRSHNLSFHFAINVICGGKKNETPAQQRINQYWYPWQDGYTAAGPSL